MTHGFSNVSRFLRVETARLPFADSAKTAVARADVAAEHESRRAIRPALKDVWATRFLANRVEIETFNQLQDVVLVSRITQSNAEPLGFGLTYFLVVADYSEFAGQLDYLWNGLY